MDIDNSRFVETNSMHLECSRLCRADKGSTNFSHTGWCDQMYLKSNIIQNRRNNSRRSNRRRRAWIFYVCIEKDRSRIVYQQNSNNMYHCTPELLLQSACVQELLEMNGKQVPNQYIYNSQVNESEKIKSSIDLSCQLHLHHCHASASTL